MPRQPLTSSTLKWKELLLLFFYHSSELRPARLRLDSRGGQVSVTSRGARMGRDHAEPYGQQQGRVRSLKS